MFKYQEPGINYYTRTFTLTDHRGALQGCVLSSALFTLLTNDCTPIHPSIHTTGKFTDDTTMVGDTLQRGGATLGRVAFRQ